VPEGDSLERLVCDHCGWIHYENPKLVVGAVATWEDRFLLCLRSIDPRKGYWTIPAGFMEMGETTEAGACREAMEEAHADLEITNLLGIYNIPRIGQVQILYRAKLRSPDVRAGEETEKVALVRWDEIPWNDLAFPSVRWALKMHRKVEGRDEFPPFTNARDEIPELPST
jgi:ADP-ribose pyrophosphatase YjhB (NUDIX family)